MTYRCVVHALHDAISQACPLLPPNATTARLRNWLPTPCSKMLALLAASCQAFVAVGAPSTVASQRAAAPQANLFDTLGKIADYNKKYFGTMAAGMMDKRTARASHVLFGFAKYEDGEKRAADLKLALDSGEITFADAAKARYHSLDPRRTLYPRRRMAADHITRCIITRCTALEAPRRAYPPRSSRRALVRPRAATWAPSSEELWCPSSTAQSSARRPSSAACHVYDVCHMHGIHMVCTWYMLRHSEAVPSRRLHSP